MKKFTYSTTYQGQLRSFSHDEKAILISMIIDFLQTNNISFNVADLDRSIDRQTKARDAQNRLTPKPTISLAKAITGAKALIKYSTDGGVPSKEMLRRSAICRGCPLISTTGGCKPCGAAATAAKFINQVRVAMKLESEIPKDLGNKFCGFCSCSIPLIIVTKLSDFHPESPEKNSKRPDCCWLKHSNLEG